MIAGCAEKSGPVVRQRRPESDPDHAVSHLSRGWTSWSVPGGWGTRRELKNPVMLDWLTASAPPRSRPWPRCARARCCWGLPACSTACTPPPTGSRSTGCAIRSRPSTVEYDQHVVEDGRVLTSAGISAGIDMALKAVGPLLRRTRRRGGHGPAHGVSIPDGNASSAGLARALRRWRCHRRSGTHLGGIHDSAGRGAGRIGLHHVA
ncbi:MAG: hypothetical protein MZV70_71245 [Desulfobacterales bacterium]|nr:hypothetical protein [Desulfobacterales bacterium]